MEKVKNIVFITVFMLMLSCGLPGCGADGTDSISAEQSAFPDEVTEEFLQESAADSEGQESAQNNFEESVVESETEEEAEPETGTAKEASEMSTEENDGSYYFSPVSYDLSNLPAMENEYYAEWEGNIYFRRYSDEDIEKGALWANFSYIPDTEKELMCLKPDGTLTQVGTDYGHGTMFIAGGRLYSQRYIKRKSSAGNDSYDSVVYSCELDGSDVTEYISYGVLALRGDWIICETRNAGMEGLAVINVQTGQERVLVDAQEQGLVDVEKQYSFLDYLEATEEEIFYYIHSGVHGDFDRGNPGADENLVLYSVDYEGNIRELATVTGEEYVEYGSEVGNEFGFPMDTAINIRYFKILGDDIYFSAGASNGSAQMYSGGPIFSMKKDGSERKVEALSYDDIFYLYDDGINRALLCSTIDEKSGRVAENGRMLPINLIGQTPQNITLRPAYGYPYDEPYVYSSTAYDRMHHTVYPDTSVLLYPDTSGICYVLLTEQDCEELSVDAYVDGSFNQDIKDVEYLDGKLFFTVTDLTYSFEDSIGWRDGYLRGRTACYCKDLKSGEISLLYEY